MGQPKINNSQLDLSVSVDALAIPKGTTVQRPTPTNGIMRYNTSNNVFEGYAGGSWVSMQSDTLSASLNGLSDVTITAPVLDQVLRFNGSSWVNSTTAATTVHSALSGLQGGTTGQYYHLTTAQYNTAAALTATSDGLFAKTGAGVYNTRQIVAPASGITIANGNGINGNPTLSLANDLAAVENIATTGFAVRTAADTWDTRTILGTTDEISVVNGDGLLGDLTLSFAPNAILPGTAAVTVPIGTTLERPTGVEGNIRYNSSNKKFEGYQDSDWIAFSPTTIDLSGFTPNLPSGVPEGTTSFMYIANDPFTLPAGLIDSNFVINDNGNSGTKTFSFYKLAAGVSTLLGTIAYASPYTTPVITFISSVTFATGESLYINGPSGGEGSFLGVFAFNIRGSI